METYNKIFDWYYSARSPEAGVEVTRSFAQHLEPASKILDIGCGYGTPITSLLLQLGFKPYGIDSATKMVERFKEALPGVPIECANVLDSAFFNTTFDAVIGYGFIFHLPHSQQEILIEKVAKNLRQGGLFLFNSGDQDGEEMTPPEYNGGESLMTYSMSSSHYKQVLHNNGMLLTTHYIEKDFGSTIYIAKKVA